MAPAAEPPTVVARPGAVVPLAAPEPGALVEAAVDGGLLAPVEGGLTAPAEGAHWLTVAARDRAGNRSAVRWLRLIVDGTPPVVRVGLSPAAVAADDGTLWVGGGTTAVARAEDPVAGVAGVTLRVGGAEASAAAPEIGLPVPESGLVEIAAKARDRAGNQGSGEAVRVHVDVAPPSVELRLEGPVVAGAEGLVAGPLASAAGAVNDAGSGVAETAFAADGQPLPEASLAGPWTEGPHRVTLTAADRVGNGVSRELAFTVDATPPELRCEVEGRGAAGDGGRKWYGPGAAVGCTASDAGTGLARLQRRHDDGSWSDWTEPSPLAAATVTVRATDRVGNAATRTFTFPVDGEPPRAELVTEDGRTVMPGELLVTVVGGWVGVTVADAASGAGASSYRVNRGGWAPLPSRIMFRNGETYEIAVRACDRLDNCADHVWPVRVVRRRKPGR